MNLSELLEEYKEVDNKQDYVKKLTDLIWKSKFRSDTYSKYYTYKINDKSLDYREDLINLFNEYKEIQFKFCKSFYIKKMKPIDYIRVHINNMYMFLTSKEVYLPKEYYKLLLTPRDEYYKTINRIKNGESVDCQDIRSNIENALREADMVKQSGIDKKLDISWKDYKKLINTYIEKIMNNYIPIHEYEEKHGWEMKVSVDGWSEDNYTVRYFCKSLSGYLRNYIRDSTPKETKQKYCVICSIAIENTVNNRKYCEECAKIVKKEQVRVLARDSMKKSRLKKKLIKQNGIYQNG